MKLYVFPYYPENAWQDLVYSAAIEEGWVLVPLDTLQGLAEVTEPGDVLHLGWTAPITRVHENDLLGSYASVTRAISELQEFANRGGRIVWTIHNVLPHERKLLLPELIWVNHLARQADRVHVMAESTEKLIAPYFSVSPDRIFKLPHPSYLGVYPEPPSKETARSLLGIPEDALFVPMIGNIRPYKGVDSVLRLSRLSGHSIVFGIAGKFSAGLSSAEVRDQAAGRILITDKYLSESEIACWCAAADVLLMPYRGVLNSGVIEMAATFGLPVVAQAHPALEGPRDEGWCKLVSFDGDLGDVISVIEELSGSSEARDAAANHAKARSPELISKGFSRLLTRLR